MDPRPLPGTTLSVSPIAFGCWATGKDHWGDDVDDATSKAAIAGAADLGVTLFDTAPLYGHGHADRILREALGPRRHEVVIATKVGVRWDTPGGHPVSDLSPAFVRADTLASLKRLGLDRIPLLQVHWPCERGTPLEATLEALFRLVDEGLVGSVGLCNYDAPTLERAARLAPIVSLQTPYSLVRREFEGALRSVCTGEHGPRRLGVLAYEPLCRGLLTGKYGPKPPHFPPSDLRAADPRFRGRRFQRAWRLVEGLRRIGRHFGVGPAQIALAWVARQTGVTAAIAGAKRPEQVEENVRAARLLDDERIPWEVVDRMAAATRL